jgi:hypothetical protein
MHRTSVYAKLDCQQQNMKAQTDHFRVSSNAQDRIKMPRVLWAGLKSIDLTPGAILRRSNLPPTVYSGESFVTTAQSFSIWQAIRELYGSKNHAHTNPARGAWHRKSRRKRSHPERQVGPLPLLPFQKRFQRRVDQLRRSAVLSF